MSEDMKRNSGLDRAVSKLLLLGFTQEILKLMFFVSLFFSLFNPPDVDHSQCRRK